MEDLDLYIYYFVNRGIMEIIGFYFILCYVYLDVNWIKMVIVIGYCILGNSFFVYWDFIVILIIKINLVYVVQVGIRIFDDNGMLIIFQVLKMLGRLINGFINFYS